MYEQKRIEEDAKAKLESNWLRSIVIIFICSIIYFIAIVLLIFMSILGIILSAILIYVLIFLQSLLLIIPGIIAAYRYSLAYLYNGRQSRYILYRCY